jgi:hypothetical protein
LHRESEVGGRPDVADDDVHEVGLQRSAVIHVVGGFSSLFSLLVVLLPDLNENKLVVGIKD